MDLDPVWSGAFCPSRIRNNCPGSWSENYKTTFADWRICKWFANFLLNGPVRLWLHTYFPSKSLKWLESCISSILCSIENCYLTLFSWPGVKGRIRNRNDQKNRIRTKLFRIHNTSLGTTIQATVYVFRILVIIIMIHFLNHLPSSFPSPAIVWHIIGPSYNCTVSMSYCYLVQ